MARLVVVRHGNTFDPGEEILRVGRRTDIPLSASGRVQAEALARHFSSSRFDLVLTSPLKRARETAEIMAPGRGEIDDALTEIDYGPDDGRPEAAVVARLGAAALAAWEREGAVPEGWIVDRDGLVSGWRALFARTRALGPGARVLAVTSNGVARFALDAADVEASSRKLRTGAYGVFEIDENGARLAAWDQRPT